MNKKYAIPLLLLGIILVSSMISFRENPHKKVWINTIYSNTLIKNSNDQSQIFIDPPEDITTNITMVDYSKGTSITGDLNSLKYKDGNNLIISPKVEGAACDYNISFYFGWEADTNFTQYSDMSYNIFLWLDFEVEDTTASICFRRLYFENETYFDSEISETIISNGYVNLTKYYCENTIGFRILESWIGVSKQIFIDRMRIVKMHNGKLYPDIIEMTDYQLNKLELLAPQSTDFSTDFMWWDNWSSGQIDVRSQETTPTSRWTRNIINISLYLPKGIYNIKKVNDFKLGYFSQVAWTGTPSGADGSGYWLNTSLTNFTDKKAQHIEEKWFHTISDKYKINTPFFDSGYWWAETYITEDYTELVQGNLTDFFNYNDSNGQYYWNFKLDGYGQTYPDDTYLVFVNHYLRYAYVNVTVEGSGFTNGYCNYPCSDTIYNKGRDYSYIDDRIHPLDLFEVQANNSARCRNNTITSSECRIVGNSYDSAWLPMPYNDSSKLWETTNIDASSLPEGYYDVWINCTDNEGLSTLNVSTLRIYNARPISSFINPDQSSNKIDFTIEIPFKLHINISDEENDPILSVYFCIHKLGDPTGIILPWTVMEQNLFITDRFHYSLTKQNLSSAIDGSTYTIRIRLEDERGFANNTRDVQIIFDNMVCPPSVSANGDSDSSSEVDSTLINYGLTSAISFSVGAIVAYVLTKRLKNSKYSISEKDVVNNKKKINKLSKNKKKSHNLR